MPSRVIRARMISRRKKTRAQQILERPKKRVIKELENLGFFTERIKSFFPTNIPEVFLRAIEAEKEGNLIKARKIIESRLDVLFDVKLTERTNKELELLQAIAIQFREPKQVRVKPLVRAPKERKKRTISTRAVRGEWGRELQEKLEKERGEIGGVGRRVPTRRITQTQRLFEKRHRITAIDVSLMPSSWIQGLDYNPDTKVINMKFTSVRRNRFYHTTKPVPESVFLRWRAGKATCITTDKSSLKRWTKGKTPSLGAFFNVFIKGRYGLVRGLA